VFEEVAASDFDGLLGGAAALWAKSVSLKIDKVVVRVAPAGEYDGERVRAAPDQNVYDGRTGTYLGALAFLVAVVIKAQALRDRLLALGAEEHRWFVVRWAAPRIESGFQLCLQKEDLRHTLRGIEYIEVSGPCEFRIAEFGLRRGRLGDVQVVWGTTTLLDRKQIVVATRDASGRNRITLMVEGSAPSTLDLVQDSSSAPSPINSDANAMFYVLNRTPPGTEELGTITSKHVLLLDAVAQCSFSVSRAAVGTDERPHWVIASSVLELQEGMPMSRGSELALFDETGAPLAN